MTGSRPAKPRHFKLVLSKSLVTDEVLHHQYRGKGTREDPYLVDFIPHDPRNPMVSSDRYLFEVSLRQENLLYEPHLVC